MFLKRQATSYLKNIIIFPPFALIVYYTINKYTYFLQNCSKAQKVRTFTNTDFQTFSMWLLQ